MRLTSTQRLNFCLYENISLTSQFFLAFPLPLLLVRPVDYWNQYMSYWCLVNEDKDVTLKDFNFFHNVLLFVKMELMTTFQQWCMYW